MCPKWIWDHHAVLFFTLIGLVYTLVKCSGWYIPLTTGWNFEWELIMLPEREEILYRALIRHGNICYSLGAFYKPIYCVTGFPVSLNSLLMCLMEGKQHASQIKCDGQSMRCVSFSSAFWPHIMGAKWGIQFYTLVHHWMILDVSLAAYACMHSLR